MAAEAHYHRSCYRGYTRQKELSAEECSQSSSEYATVESKAYEMIEKYIRDLLENPKVIKLTNLTEKLVSQMKNLGIQEVKESTKKHLRRKLEATFGDLLQFETIDEGKKQLIVIPSTLSRLQLARENIALNDKLALSEKCRKESLHLTKAALIIRSSIKSKETEMSWPPKPSELHQSSINLPDSLTLFLHTLLTGSADPTHESSPRIQRLINSYGQDLVFGVSSGTHKTPKHVLLPYAIKSLTNNVELIQIINRCGHGVSYTQLEEIDTALCLQKMAKASEDRVPLPEKIQLYVNTTLAWDNIDRLEETLSGEGTSHRVNGIAVQPRVFGPQLPPQSEPVIVKERKHSIDIPPSFIPVYNAGDRVGPPSRKYVEVKCETVVRNAWKKNLLWVLTRLHATANNGVSGWTGFNISTRNELSVSQDNVGYLPTINAPASNLSTVYEVLTQSLKIKDTLALKSIVVVFDQALYAKATEIIWKKHEQFKNIVPRMGAFQTICTLLAVIGKRFQDAGLKDLCIESRVIAEGSVSGVLDGRRYNRAVRFHKLVYEALLRLAWKGFPSWLQVSHQDKQHIVQDIAEVLKNLSTNLCQKEAQEAMENPLFSNVFELFHRYLDHLRYNNGNLSTFWMSYIDVVQIMLGLLRSSREGDWSLHLSSIREMIPWCFAYDHLNYARYLSAYLSQMSHLKQEHPEVHEHLASGGFSVQIGGENTFGRIPLDQTCEETVNKDTQTPGGTKGFSLKPGAVSRYYMVAEYRSIFLSHLRDMLQLKSHFNHADLQSKRKVKDEQDVQSLMDMLENNWIDPFNNENQELISISTGKSATPEIASDLLNANKRGELAYKDFSQKRIESSPPRQKFNDSISKLKLKTFSDLEKKKKIGKESGKEIILKADRLLFGPMIVIAESRSLSMKDVLSHPLGPLPWSLASTDGSLRKTNKSALARKLESNIPPAESIPRPCATIIDCMSLVQKLKGDQKTFSEVADTLLCMALHECPESQRVDLVFDVYRSISIKNIERQNRATAAGTQSHNISPGHKVQQWKKFLAEGSNKRALAVFLSTEWKQDKYREKLGNKVLYVTCEDQCHKISADEVQIADELRSTQEEADTRLIFHTAHAASNGYNAVVIVAEDTDVFVLCISFQSSIACPIYQKCGTQTRTRYIDITKVAQAYGEELCKALPGLHAFTGCDSVSAFAGRLKVNALQQARRDKSAQKPSKNWERNGTFLTICSRGCRSLPATCTAQLQLQTM